MSEQNQALELSQCPTCGKYSPIALPSTRKRDDFADNLLNPKYTTIYDAAIAAGYSPSSAKSYAHVVGVKLRQSGALAHKQRLRLDKASGQRKLATKLLDSAAEDVDAGVAKMDTPTKIQLGGSLLKLAVDTEAAMGGQDDGAELANVKVRVIRKRLTMLRGLALAAAEGRLSPTAGQAMVRHIDEALGKVR